MRTALFILALCSCINAQASKFNIAVYNFASDNLSKTQTTELTQIISEELRKEPSFNVMEGPTANQILGPANNQGQMPKTRDKTECVSDHCIAEMGKQLGVELMIIGNANKVGTQSTFTLSLQDIANEQKLSSATIQLKGGLDNIRDSIPALLQKIKADGIAKKTANPTTPQTSATTSNPNDQAQLSTPWHSKTWVKWTFGIIAGLYLLKKLTSSP